MPFVPATDCASSAINGVFGSKAIANVLNWHFPGGYTQTDLDNLSAMLDQEVDTTYKGLFCNSVTYQNVHVRGLSTVIDLESINSTNTGVGTEGASCVAANVTCCITARTGFTGRSARGRFYTFPGVTGELQTVQTWTAAYAAAVAAWLNGLITAGNLIGAEMVVLSRFTGGAPRLAALPTAITSWSVTNVKVDSQRGRLLPGH